MILPFIIAKKICEKVVLVIKSLKNVQYVKASFDVFAVQNIIMLKVLGI